MSEESQMIGLNDLEVSTVENPRPLLYGDRHTKQLAHVWYSVEDDDEDRRLVRVAASTPLYWDQVAEECAESDWLNGGFDGGPESYPIRLKLWTRDHGDPDGRFIGAFQVEIEFVEQFHANEIAEEATP